MIRYLAPLRCEGMSSECCVNVLDEKSTWEREGYRSVIKIIPDSETSRYKFYTTHKYLACS